MSISRFLSFAQWKQRSDLFENVQAAKSYIQRKYAKNLGKPTGQLSPEEIKKSLEDKSFRDILKLTEKNPGYAFPFLKFHLEQGIPISIRSRRDEIRDLKSLLNWMVSRGNLVSRLPKTIDQYSNESNENGLSGFESLTDAIRTLERNISAKWLVDRLPAGPRQEFRSLPAKEQQKFLNFAHALEELDKGDPSHTITNRLMDKIKAMENLSFEEISNYISKYLEGYSNIDLQRKIEEIKSLSPEAGIIYSEPPYLVLSIRNENAQRKLCSIANWCINRGAWKNYVGNNGVQINIFDYSLPPSHNMFLTGTTIGYDKEVNASCDLNNDRLGWESNPEKHFKKIGYPSEVVQAIVSQLPGEIQIKKTLENVLGESFDGGKIDKEVLLSSLFGLAGENIQGKLPEGQWSVIIEIVTEILKKGGTISLKDIINFFTDNGIFSLPGLKVFDSIVKPFISSSQRKKIYLATEGIFDEIEKLYLFSIQKGPEMQTTAERAKKMLQNKKTLLSKVRGEHQ